MQVFTQFDTELESIWGAALSKEPNAWPFFTYSWHKMWYQHLGRGEKLAIIGSAATPIVLPLSIDGGSAHFTGGEEIADYLDIIGASEHKAEAWKQTLSLLKRQGATHLLLRNVPNNSPTLKFFKSLDTSEISEEDTTPILALPQTFEQYLSALGRKERHELRRKMRRFQEQYPDVSFEAGDTLHIEVLLTLMRKNQEKQEFLTSGMVGFFRNLPRVAPTQFQQFTLLRGGKPVAITIGFRVNDSLLLYNSGYDLEGSGWYLKAKIIERAIQAGLTSINFLQGGERYKYDFGATDFPIFRIALNL